MSTLTMTALVEEYLAFKEEARIHLEVRRARASQLRPLRRPDRA